MNPVRSALKNRSVVLVLTGFAVLLGVGALFTMPRREDPKITIRTGLVLARYPGASAQQVEEQVTRKIEERLFRHEEVRKTKTFSTSRDGVAVVNVELEDKVKDPDRFWAMLRHDMNELHATDLPASVQGPIVNSSFGDVVAMLLAVRGPTYGPRELRDYLDKIDDAIRTIPEVSRINRIGEQREELRVSTTNARLAGFGITPFDVAGAIRSRTALVDAGTIDAGDAGRVPIAANNLLSTESALSQLLVGTSRDGRPVHLGDFATVERQYADPQFVVRVDGESTVLLAVEMQEGHNIVEFGNKVREKLTELRATLPPDLMIQPIADQPQHVQQRMIEFGREFLITLAAVILVTVLLLPLRVAAIAAVAIPITVAITVAILNAVGIELHQVTFAGLVVALGIVVDDAIVVVDNYVEKLDHGMSRFEAAWRSPTELAVPVLAATLTIVASFLPLAYLPGAPGEFIRAMSFTVAIALMVSFAIAMLLTPMLALTLVKTGLHQAPNANARQRRTPLDVMQSAYERVMSMAMPRKRLTMVGAVLAFFAGLGLMSAVPYRFFPMNERDQLIVDLWMPAGTRIAGTDEVLRRLADSVRRERGVRTVAAFTGGGAPRFYYNHNPEPPTPNFGELLINTESPEATDALVARLHSRANSVAPEGWVYVKPLQQGPVFAAPNEIRLVGDDASLLRTFGDSVAQIFEHTPGSAYVHTDWRDQELALGLNVRPEVATRLGLSDADIAMQLSGAFAGAPISTYWEGKRDLDVVFRLDGAERSGMNDVAATTLVSPTTGARIPLREVAGVAPEFRPSRIVRRNGVRTLTVRSFAAPDILPSVVLKAATPKLAALKLPAGMRLEFGGEKEGSAEVQGAVNIALLASLVGVFLILLFQFRTVRHPLVIMTSIPLALVGAAIGLVITGNPFTYTANLGLNALTGVVVRNAIILVDYANELRRSGVDIETAALLAGRRRLRPIFLTTMAAALGVTPMILSRSPLWSPMASVIAVGLVVSMIFTLVLVPVLYVVIERRQERRAARRAHDDIDTGVVLPSSAKVPASIAAMRPASVALIIGFAAVAMSVSPRHAEAQTSSRPVAASPAMRLTIDDAISLAMKQSYATRLAGARLESAEAHEHGAAADLLPQLSLSGNHLRSSGRTTIVVPRGALGDESSGAPLPASDRRFDQGAAALTYTQLSFTQPVTQLWRIRQAQQLASAQTLGAAADRARTESDITLAVERLYAAVLIARAREHAAEVALRATRQQTADVEQAVAAGINVSAQGLGATASALDAEYARMAAADSASDAEAQLRNLLALRPGTQLELVVPAAPTETLSSLDVYLAKGLAANPDIAAASATFEQAQHASALARASYIPDVGVGVTYTMLNGVSFLPQHAVGLSIQGSWTVLDWGKRGSVSHERAAQEEAAAIGVALARDQVSVDVEHAYRNAVRADRGAAVAHAAVEARRAELSIMRDRASRGLTPAAALAGSEADMAEGEVRALAADLQTRITRAELTRAVGRSIP